MTREDEYRRLADAEIERHRNDLLYADRQLLKRGEHRAVIARIRERRRESLAALAMTCALFARDLLLFAIFLGVFGVAVLAYARVKRTEETLRRLARERGA